MDIPGLEAELTDAADALKRVGATLRELPMSAAIAELRAAKERLLRAERALADAKGQEYAAACDGFPAWDVGAPLPHLIANGSHKVLVYFTREPDPNWDGRMVELVDSSRDLHIVAVVRFKRVASVRMGAPNDEVIEGHPLHGRGLDAYAPHVVKRSSWIEELRQINSVHRGYDAAWWSKLNHYLLPFHDETFECVAESFTATTKLTTLSEASRDALESLFR